MKNKIILLAAFAAFIAPNVMGSIISGPIRNPANGHDYYLLSNQTWTASEVEAMTLGGHLVTINDLAENTFVYSTFSHFGGVNRGLWIGLNDAALEGTYVWSSGAPVSYLNWGTSEPRNQGNGDNYVHIFWPSDPRASAWNDATNASSYNGIPINGVVEVDPRNKIFINSVTQVECNTGKTTVFFTVSLLDAPTAPVSVDWATANGTAIAPGDYTARNGTVNFVAGPIKSKTIAVKVNGNTVAEPDEDFNVNLTNPVGASIAVGQGFCTIVNDD